MLSQHRGGLSFNIGVIANNILNIIDIATTHSNTLFFFVGGTIIAINIP